MKIRRLDPDDHDQLLPLRAYSFEATPMDERRTDEVTRYMSYRRNPLTLVAEDDGEPVASVSGVPMRQNVRGVVHPMLGVSGVVSHPLARRRGHVRVLLQDLLGRGRDEGRPVSVLFPFRASFYERLGYVGLGTTKTVTIQPEALTPLLRLCLPGEVRVRRIADAWDDLRELLGRSLTSRHGFTEFPDYRAAQLRDENDHWLVTAHRDGRVTGGLAYRITGYGGDLAGQNLLYDGPLTRALLLRFLAGHTDQVARITMWVAPGDRPELWTTDFAGTIASTHSVPHHAPPMARVLDLPALTGTPAGETRVAITVTDDPFIGGGWVLDGAGGALTVKPGDADADVRLTAAALSGLVYGVLGPEEIVARGLGEVPSTAWDGLSTLFPRADPWVFLDF